LILINLADTRVLTGTVFDVWGCANASAPGASNVRETYDCGEHLRTGEPTPACKTSSTWRCATDFERYNGGDSGIVNYLLDTTNRVPTLSSGSHPSVINANQFTKWYVVRKTHFVLLLIILCRVTLTLTFISLSTLL
jgi:hypothetical protein